MFITFKALQGMASWGVALVLLLVLVGFFPVAILVGVAVIWGLTTWRASQ